MTLDIPVMIIGNWMHWTNIWHLCHEYMLLQQLRKNNTILPESHASLSEDILKIWGSRLAEVLWFTSPKTSATNYDDYSISERELEESGLRS